MIEVEIWSYVESESRMVRFSRKANISAAPFIGAEIAVENDHITIDRVIFQDGGGIVCVADNDQTEAERIYIDTKLNEVIDDMKDIGWNVASNVKRKQKKVSSK